MARKMKILLLSLMLASCSNHVAQNGIVEMSQKREDLKFPGLVRVFPRARPSEPFKVEYRDDRGKVSSCGIPLSQEVMNSILNSSNFVPRESMMRGVANLYFQGGYSPCPDGDNFSVKKEADSSMCEINAVDRNGRLWRLKVESREGKHQFSSVEKRKVYENLMLFGG
ncbi:hypothetical protein [Luteolibacter soli]|uniref:Lipoprotein n=1 Tax=Luteolibacter soli TaxID=3135280 RepID=A0ABU9AUM9_9BACT